MTPVPKKGDLSIVSKYRPISLLNSEDNVSERLLFKHLYDHLHRHNLISSLQSGIMPGDSTVNQLAIPFVKHLMLERKCVLSSLTSAKHLTEFGIWIIIETSSSWCNRGSSGLV